VAKKMVAESEKMIAKKMVAKKMLAESQKMIAKRW